jgi:hypothetical protein
VTNPIPLREAVTDDDPSRAGMLGVVTHNWTFLVGGITLIFIGLAVWWTAFVLIPVGLALVVLGIVRSARHAARRPSDRPGA